MSNCYYITDGKCTYKKSPLCGKKCLTPDVEGVCRYEERSLICVDNSFQDLCEIAQKHNIHISIERSPYDGFEVIVSLRKKNLCARQILHVDDGEANVIVLNKFLNLFLRECEKKGVGET